MRIEDLATTAVVVGCLTLAGWAAGRAQSQPSVQVFQAETGMQVVLETTPTKDGRFWVRPKTPVYFRLVPKDPAEHYAPLPPHSFMICREFNYKGPDGQSFAGFRCGTDTYALEAFGFTKSEGIEGDTERRRNLGVPALLPRSDVH